MQLAHYIEIAKKNCVIKITSLIAYTKAKWWGVSFKKRILVNGKIYFRRVKNSKISIGKNCKFNSSYTSNLIGVNRLCMISTLQKGAVISIGNNCGFSGTVIGAFESIQIGNNVRCGANSLITDSDWHLDDPRSGKPIPVIISDNVWIGVNVTVLKGVTIGENSVIGAGSVVTKSIPSNVVAAGNPCRIIKNIEI